MTWFKVDDSLPDHPKMLRLQSHKGWQSALALWTLAGAWSSKHLTDGEVPAAIVERFGCARRDAELLVACGFWEKADNGYTFHDWKARNPSREDIEAKREKTRNKVSEWRRNQVTQQPSNQQSNPAPVPTRPDPSPSLRSGGERVDAPPLGAGRTVGVAESGMMPVVDVMGLQLALGQAAELEGWDSAPEVMASQLAKAAKRVPAIAQRHGITRDQAALKLCRMALQRSRATGQAVAFALLEADSSQPVQQRRGGRPTMAAATTHEDFADAEPMEVQLARLREA